MSKAEKNLRILVLQGARERKDILFKAFSPCLTKRMKENAWDDVRKEALAAGASSLANRDWKYVRDTIYGAARRDAMSKRDKEKRSGEGTVQYTEADELVFDIVGKESAAVSGLDVPDSEEQFREADDVDIMEISQLGDFGKTPTTSSSVLRIRTPSGISRTSQKSKSSESEELDIEIKRAKLRLLERQITGQELQNEERRLNVNKLKSETSESIGGSRSASGQFKQFDYDQSLE